MFEKYKELILVIGGIVIFFWIAIVIEKSYNESKERDIDKKVTKICNVIKRQQPNNLALYDDCWTTGMEEFSSEN